MDVINQMNSLMRLPLSEIKALPKSGSTEMVDPEGRRFQIVTWCEQVTPDKYRIVVSLHRMHALGASSLTTAEGFTVDASGKVERLEQQQVQNLFL